MKFFLDNLWLVALALISGGALAFPVLQRRGQKISILQATQLLNANKAVLVDVRDAAERANGHQRDAKHIPLGELAARAGELDKWKDKTVVAVCQSGVRSAKATGILKKAGFESAYSLDGGIEAWQAQGLPLVK